MAEFARDTYSKTGAHLLSSIAIVHPFIISILLDRAETAVGTIGEVRGASLGAGHEQEGEWHGMSISTCVGSICFGIVAC